jgi:chemotaxis protein MotB
MHEGESAMRSRVHCLAVSTIVTVVSGSLLSGCVVSQKKYDELDDSFRRTRMAMQATIDERDAAIAEMEENLAAEERRAAELERRIRALQADIDEARETLASGEAERQKLATDLANVVRDRSQLRQSVEDMERALAELSARKAAADRRIAEFRNLVSRFQSLIDAGRLRVRIVDGRMVVELATDVLFASGSARLSDEGRAAVKEVAEVLAELSGRRFQVEGHTDNVPIRTAQFPSNWELASARALTVVHAMVEGGVPPENVSGASFGEHKPTAENETPEGRAANRRIEIVLLPDLSTLPGFEELQRISTGPAE